MNDIFDGGSKPLWGLPLWRMPLWRLPLWRLPLWTVLLWIVLLPHVHVFAAQDNPLSQPVAPLRVDNNITKTGEPSAQLPSTDKNQSLANEVFVDDVKPSIVINSHDSQQVESAILTITGVALDNHKVANIVAQSSSYGDQQFGVQWLSDGHFSSQIPLKNGDNILTFTATDAAGNFDSATVSVQKVDTTTPIVSITSPANGTKVNTQKISVSGRIVTSLDLAKMTVSLAGATLSKLQNIGENTWIYTFSGFILHHNVNQIIVEVRYPKGKALAWSSVEYDEVIAQGPKIRVTSPHPNSNVQGSDFFVQGEVNSQANIQSLTINGEQVHLTRTSTSVSFNYPVDFTQGSEIMDLVIVATDSNQHSTSETISYSQDTQGPVLTIHSPLDVSPAVNTVIENPYYISGTVVDSALSAVFINGQNITVSPGSADNSFDFELALTLTKGENYELTVQAHDMAGNKTTLAYNLYANPLVSIDIIAPSGNSDFLADGNNIDLSILARVKGLTEGDVVRANVDSQTAVPVELKETLVNTTISTGADSGEHELTMEVVDNLGAVLASSRRKFNIVNSQDIALSLRTEPYNDQTEIEPNGAISLYFNKPVDMTKLEVEVRQTAHGLTWINEDPSGADFTQALGFVLKQVNKDNEIVPGGLSVLPSDNIVEFSPQSDLVYGAKVMVAVTYEGKDMARFSYSIRDLPTLVNGSVFDQLGQGIRNVEVSIPALGLVTRTNSNGGFNFGYGVSKGKPLSGGRFELVVNPQMSNTAFGIEKKWVTLEKGRVNQLDVLWLVRLNVETPFQRIASGQSQISLAGGELLLDLSQAQLSFEGGQTNGNVHVSFINSGQSNLKFIDVLTPNWLYVLQPAAIQVTGKVGLDIKMPKLYNSYRYVPDDGSYVVLLGKDRYSATMVPIGIGVIDKYRVKSVGMVQMNNLDYVAYALVVQEHQALLSDVVNGHLPLISLSSALLAN